VANDSNAALYDVWWGYVINNPNGNAAAIWSADAGVPEGVYDTTLVDFYDTLVPWATTTLGITI
jgi:hypothetical protein